VRVIFYSLREPIGSACFERLYEEFGCAADHYFRGSQVRGNQRHPFQMMTRAPYPLHLLVFELWGGGSFRSPATVPPTGRSLEFDKAGGETAEPVTCETTNCRS